MNPSKKFNLIPGEKREKARSDYARASTLNGTIGTTEVTDVAILGISFGQVTLQIPEGIEISKALINDESSLSVSLKLNEDLIITGNWFITPVRKSNGHLILNLDHPEKDTVSALAPVLQGEHFMRADFMKVFAQGSTQGAEAISGIFTDLVDFGKRVPCNIFGEGKTTSTTFNFEARQKQLSEIYLVLPANFKLPILTPVIIEFKFLAVRYVFAATVLAYDQNFGILSVTPPSAIAALTTRRYDRTPCNIDAVLLRDNAHSTAVKITSISATGCEINLDGPLEAFANCDYALSIPRLDLQFPVALRDRRGQALGLSFADNQNHILEIRKLFNECVKPPNILRTPEHYPVFLELYKKVGYGPTPGDELWEEKTIAAWKHQDSVLPGNTIGTLMNGELINSFGILPIAQRTAGTHSLAMEKSIHSIGYFLELINHNLSNLDLIPHIQYYFGSVRTSSRFTSRLYTLFEHQSKPTLHETYFCLSVNPGPSQDSAPPLSYSINECFEHHEDDYPTLRFFDHVLSSEHELLKNIQFFNHFEIKNQSGTTVAFIKSLKMPTFYTAVNIFSVCFCFILSPEFSEQEALDLLTSSPHFSNQYIEIFRPDFEKSTTGVKTQRKVDEAFYFVFAKDEIGTLLANMHRAAWRILQKYGDAADPYLEKAIA